MTVHTGWKRKKPGLFDMKIQEARNVRSEAFLEVKENCAGLMVACYGGYVGVPEAVLEHFEWMEANEKAITQHLKGRVSEQGDFTNCYRGGFY